MTTSTATLTSFLLDRIAEDEANAGSKHDLAYHDHGDCGGCEYPARVLAECEAKRRIVEQARNYSPELEHGDNGEWAFDTVLLALALPYADHPDYREEWRP